MKAHQRAVGAEQEWLTPRWVLDPLGEFDLDPCAPSVRPWSTAAQHVSLPEDGLSLSWEGRVWCNPPFDRRQRWRWMQRMAQHGNGIMLVPAACETVAFKDWVFGKAEGILMLHSRPHFCDTSGTPAKANSGCTICLVAYGADNLEVLRGSGLGTLLVESL